MDHLEERDAADLEVLTMLEAFRDNEILMLACQSDDLERSGQVVVVRQAIK